MWLEVLEVSCGWRCCHVTVGAGGVVMWLEVLSCDCRCWRCCHVAGGVVM